MKKFAFICSDNNKLNFSFSDFDFLSIKNKDDFNRLNKLNYEYFILCSSNVTYDKNINFYEVINFMEKNNINIFSFMPCNSDSKKLIKINKSGFYDVNDKIINLNYDTYIIKKDFLCGMKYSGDFESLIVEILSKYNKYYISCENKVFINNCDYLGSSWYIDSLKNFKRNISSSLLNQKMYLYMYLKRLKYNIGFVK